MEDSERQQLFRQLDRRLNRIETSLLVLVAVVLVANFDRALEKFGWLPAILSAVSIVGFAVLYERRTKI